MKISEVLPLVFIVMNRSIAPLFFVFGLFILLMFFLMLFFLTFIPLPLSLLLSISILILPIPFLILLILFLNLNRLGPSRLFPRHILFHITILITINKHTNHLSILIFNSVNLLLVHLRQSIFGIKQVLLLNVKPFEDQVLNILVYQCVFGVQVRLVV